MYSIFYNAGKTVSDSMGNAVTGMLTYVPMLGFLCDTVKWGAGSVSRQARDAITLAQFLHYYYWVKPLQQENSPELNSTLLRLPTDVRKPTESELENPPKEMPREIQLLVDELKVLDPTTVKDSNQIIEPIKKFAEIIQKKQQAIPQNDPRIVLSLSTKADLNRILNFNFTSAVLFEIAQITSSFRSNLRDVIYETRNLESNESCTYLAKLLLLKLDLFADKQAISEFNLPEAIDEAIKPQVNTLNGLNPIIVEDPEQIILALKGFSEIMNSLLPPKNNESWFLKKIRRCLQDILNMDSPPAYMYELVQALPYRMLKNFLQSVIENDTPLQQNANAIFLVKLLFFKLEIILNRDFPNPNTDIIRFNDQAPPPRRENVGLCFIM